MGATVGGRVDIKLGGRTYHPVAEVEVEASDIEVETVTNQDGTGGRAVKPKPYKVKLKIRDMDGLDEDSLMKQTFDFSMVERDTNRSLLMTGAWVEGTPSRNTANGEIDGLTIAGFARRVLRR